MDVNRDSQSTTWGVIPFPLQLQVECCSSGQVDWRGSFLGVLRKIKRCAYEVNTVHLEHIQLCPDVWKYVMYFYGNLSPLIEWVYVTAMAEWQTGLLMPSLDSYSQFGSLPMYEKL